MVDKMKKLSFCVVATAFILSAIAALAADAAAPTAPAVQGAVWTTADYLRAALSGAAGGLISGFVALVIGWMNNRNALKLNQQKINADREAQEKSYKQQIERLCYEEKRQLCTELLQEISEFNLANGNFDVHKAWDIYAKLSFVCGFEYRKYANNMVQLINNDSILIKGLKSYNINKKEKEERDEFFYRVKKYMSFHNAFVIVTQKMLAGEDLLPSTKWNLDDFEGSVPLDYRQGLP